MQQTMMPFLADSLAKIRRRKSKGSGPFDLPLSVDAEPYMNALVAIDDLLRIIQPAMKFARVSNAVQRVVTNCKELRDSVAYYENCRKSA